MAAFIDLQEYAWVEIEPTDTGANVVLHIEEGCPLTPPVFDAIARMFKDAGLRAIHDVHCRRAGHDDPVRVGKHLICSRCKLLLED